MQAPSSLMEMIEDDFERSSQVDRTIQKLREQIPLLLVQPLDKSSASQLYSDSVVLLGPNDEVLSSDIDELIALSTTLVTAWTASREASRLARSFALSPSLSTTSEPAGQGIDSDDSLVSSHIILDASRLDQLQVHWEATLLPSTSSIVSGLSQLTLDQNGLISKHQLRNFKIDDQPVNAVGEALATLRRAFKSVQTSPLLSFASTSFPLLNELLQQAAAVAAATSNSQDSIFELPPLFAVESLKTTLTGRDDYSTRMYNDTMVPIDSYHSPSPLPGSSRWKIFESAYLMLQNFIERDILVLSEGAPNDELVALFSPNCTWIAMDGSSVVCSGGEAVADFFRVLASLRQGIAISVLPIFGNSDYRQAWNVVPIKVDWKERSVVVRYVSDYPVRVQGTDRYKLSLDGRIDTIEQLELFVQGSKVEDPEWFRQFYLAIQTGRKTALGSNAILDLLDQYGAGRNLPSINQGGPPILNDEAAASVYRILCAFHQDFESLNAVLTATTTAATMSVIVPAASFLAPAVELRGYLNEVLVRGEKSYRAAMVVAITSLRSILSSEQVMLEKPPKPTVFFLSDGTLRVDVVLSLRVLPIVGFVGGFLDKSSEFSGVGGLPLKVEFKSLYRVNQDGKIIEHSIMETRVNDQLTPGDVVVRFWKGTTEKGASGSTTSSVWDAMKWLRLATDNK